MWSQASGQTWVEDLVGYIVPAATQDDDGLAKVAAVPEHDGGDEQVQAAGTVQLALVGAVADLPEPVEEDSLAEIVAGLALVQARLHLVTERRAAQEVEDEARVLQATELDQLFAHCAALTVMAVCVPWDRRPRTEAGVETLATALALDLSVTWQPTVRSYFGRVPKARVLEAVREAVGEEAAAWLESMKTAHGRKR